MVGGTALAALLLHPDNGLSAKGRGPLGGNAVLVVGLALLSLLVGLGLYEKFRDQPDTVRELDSPRQRMAHGISRVLRVGAWVVPLLILVLHRFDSYGSNHGPDDQPDRESSSPPLPPQDPASTRAPAEHAAHTLYFGLSRILLILAVALLVVVVVVAALRLWRYLTRPQALAAPATYETLDDEQERLVQAVDSGRRALLDGADARAAVIACYAAMEQSLADSGLTRRASDSPQDLLERAVAGGLPNGAAATTLTTLFREARYSTHPMDGSHRDLAAAALAEIADGLRSGPSRPEARTGTS
ncbi:hypothetical protein WN71_000850 [Streptomyces mangrovisoli]|uniref:Protein-glutamine gamma-glutamyltransferase-like C-terminal domain-containing protein n=2 Tax=Streptomyces mangrovisoli TaxID=1428628 RepID=A0A1J4P5B0_9ACTN|nr:hypothetical protein WN71_000850 [Streptomyces mangrovisoli]